MGRPPGEPALQAHNRRFVRRINDIYVDTASVVSLLDRALSDSAQRWGASEELHLRVPARNGFASIRRKRAQVHEILKGARSTGQWEKSLIFVVSLAEDHIASYLRMILRLQPILLLTSIRRNEARISVGLAEMINVGIEAILEEQIDSRIVNALYASPKDYIGYLEEIVGCRLERDVVGRYVELKARRDIIIHADGIVNQLYLDKAGEFAAGAESGSRLQVDRAYFELCVMTIKKLSQSLHERVLERFGHSDAVEAALGKPSQQAAEAT